MRIAEIMIRTYPELVAVDGLFHAWILAALALATAALVLGSTTKSGGWFWRGMLALACVLVGYGLSVATLTSARLLITATGH